MTDWFARTILQVKDVEASLRFYSDKLGFTTAWSFGDNGKLYVAQVDRQGTSLILSNSWTDRSPEKTGKAVIFISLNTEPDTPEAGIVAVDAVRAELESKGVAVKEDWWGYRLLRIDDPDGNQLLFNYANENATR